MASLKELNEDNKYLKRILITCLVVAIVNLFFIGMAEKYDIGWLFRISVIIEIIASLVLSVLIIGLIVEFVNTTKKQIIELTKRIEELEKTKGKEE